ncbi:MAG: radical SAM family heme chaperone HemW [Gemmatimonadales bacterium]|nr:radical SAM family heme chaperone HemW [Gemmatimonadales bacterium]
MHVYIHVPFCARRCSYCDFAIAVRRTTPSDAFVRAVLDEWASWQDHPVWVDTPPIATVYFGGGTPSRLNGEALGAILRRIRSDRVLGQDAEVTLEANPEDVSAAAVEAWQAIGINRISLGAQSFDPAVLTWMHRTHTHEQTGDAVRALRRAGFGNLSLDLIFGAPRHLGRDWSRDLEEALALEPTHVSLYGLTVEDRTPLSRWIVQGRCRAPDDDRAAEEYLRAHDRLEARGFEHYEVSNASLPGYRARHNSAYWDGADYLGLGPSAHSYVGDERRWNVREWVAYERTVRGGGSVVAGRERVNGSRQRLERLYLGLRTNRGVRAGLLPASLIERWRGSGWAIERDGRVCLTSEGWLRLDALIAAVA